MNYLGSTLPIICASLLAFGFHPIAQATDVLVQRDSRIEVIYIAAADCIYCKSWRHMRAGDWSRFSETETGRAVTLVTVDKGTLRNSMKRDYYPKEHAGLFDKASQFGNVVPAWWVLVDGVPVIRRVGEDKWKSSIEPVLEKLVSAKRNGGGSVSGLIVPPPKPVTIPIDVNDAENVPYISGRAKESYRKFLSMSTPRAFALSLDGTFYWYYGGTDPRKKALDNCNAYAIDFPCKLYAVDKDVVWRNE